MSNYPFIITAAAGLTIILLFVVAHYVDKFDKKTSAQNLYRAARVAKVRTYITESNKDPRIVGEVVSVPRVPISARIRDIDPVGA